MERNKMICGFRIKQIIGLVSAVLIATFVLVFGEHNPVQDGASETFMDARYEAEDGDLDFGYLSAGDDSEGDESENRQEVAGVTQKPEPAKPTESAVTECEDEQFFYTVEDGVAIVTEWKDSTKSEVIIPSEVDGIPVEVIGEYVFQNCSNLERVTLPEGLKVIRWNAFENCTALKTICFPKSLTTICECAFWNTGLTEVMVPETVRILEDYAFYSCENLVKLTLSTTSNLDVIFDMSVVESVTLEEGVSVIEEDAFGGAEALRQITFPSTLTMIKQYAFWECSALECVEIPDAVVTIGANAFENCSSLCEVKLPSGLLLLSEYAFVGCQALETLELPAEITTIQDFAFADCDQLVLSVTAGSIGEEYAIVHEMLYEIR